MKTPQSKRRRKLTEEQQAIVQKAAAFCVRHFPTLWTAGWPRREEDTSSHHWIIPVVLRYDPEVEGEVGSLAYNPDTDTFTVLTERTVMSQRAREVAQSLLFQP